MALVREAMRWLSQDQPAIWAAGTDAILIDCAAAKLMSKIPEQPPSFEPDGAGGRFRADELDSFYDELGRFRTTPLKAAVGSGLQLVALGFRLEPSKKQAKILNDARKSLHGCRGQASRSSSAAAWVGDQFRTALPSFERDATGEDLADWIGALAEKWAADGPEASTVITQWKTLAKALHDAAPTLRELDRDLPSEVRLPADLAQEWTDDQQSIRYLTKYVLPDEAGVESLPGNATVEQLCGQVCGRLLALHVAERGLLAAPPSVDQRVDLVQVSADTRSLLDPGRNLAGKKLTGIQVHNFGAFYKSSWRADDWMWGRVDGAGWLVHALLDPRRLRSLRDKEPGGRDTFAGKVASTFKRLGWVCAGDSDDADAKTLLEDVENLRASLDKELAFLGLNGNLEQIDEATAIQASLPVSMPTTALVLARGIQSIIAADEHPVVAKAAADDCSICRRPGRAWP